MNKYIITHEKIKMQNREEQDFIVAALYNQGKKIDRGKHYTPG